MSVAASAVAATCCAVAAVWLMHRPATRVPSVAPGPEPPGADVALLTRLRPALAALVGAAAWAFLGGTGGLLAAPVAVGVAWRLLGGVESPEAVRRRQLVEAELPVVVDLAASGLEAGLAVVDALEGATAALPGAAADELAPWLRRIRLGADPARVWHDLARTPHLAPLGRALARAHDSGASVALAGRRLADDLRRDRLGAWEARARAVSIRAAAPMGACFLPAFLLLGIAPLVGSLLTSLSLG